MTYKAAAITTYHFSASDELLLDANIWLLIYGPQQPGDRRVATYSGAFHRMLAAQSRIYIDVLIVSEFINAYARSKWRLLAPSSTDFKQFRQSGAFKPIAQDVAADMKRVLQHCTRVADGFELLTIEPLLNEYALGESDFNDQILIDLCRRQGLKMVTDDSDFKGQDISLITRNQRLLT